MDRRDRFWLESASTGLAACETVVRRRILFDMRVPGIQFSLFSSSSSCCLPLFPILVELDAVRTLDRGLLRGLFDSSRPSEDTVRDNFRRFSCCTEPGTGIDVVFWFAAAWFDRMFCLEESEARWLRERDRNRPGELPSAEIEVEVEVELDKALRASVSKVDCQTRGSRERPKVRSLSAVAAARGVAPVAGKIALWLLRRLRLL